MVFRYQVADTESGKAHALGDGEDGDRPLPHAGQGRRRNELDSVVDVVFESLVADEHEVVLHDEFRQLFEVLPAVDRAGRVRRMGDEDHLGLRGQAFLELLDAELPFVLFIGGDADAGAAQQLDVAEVVRVAGIQAQDFVAFLDEGGHGEEQAGIRARGYEDVADRVHLDVVLLPHLLGDDLSELIVACRHRVVGRETALDRLDDRLLYAVGDGRIRRERVRDRHDIHAGGGELRSPVPHVRLGDLGEETAFEVPELVVHQCFNVHRVFSSLISRVDVSELQISAMASISQRTPFGRVFTAQQLLAGLDTKYFA